MVFFILEKQVKQIYRTFGAKKFKETYLDDLEVSLLRREFEKKFPSAKYDYGMGSFVYSVCIEDADKALDLLKDIMEKNDLRKKYVMKRTALVSKDLIYAEAPKWMHFGENKYDKKKKEGLEIENTF